ncbi:3-ketoacyl-CoA synthase 5-like [Tasmannia lanceolata]|uniref:3-ketoacyl-CoA synthase 5-like n=1 Tax=Tasmannia lanceolata TaxID=3420 RepID=UPI0040649827
MPKPLPDFSGSVKLKYVKLGYSYLVDYFLTFLLIPLMVGILLEIHQLGPNEIIALYKSLHFNLIHILSSLFLLVFFTTVYFMSKPRPVYLLEHACFKPPITCRFPSSKFISQTKQINNFDPISVDFQVKIIERSGLGDETSLPPSLHHVPHHPTMEDSREEAELVIFTVIDNVLKKTGIKPRDIGILVVNCSLFSPTPSLSAMVVNKYKMRSNIITYNLSGMGCSAGPISIDLARDLLQIHPNSYALVISTEIITQYWYTGNQRSMLLANCLFRMGGAAVILTNRRSERRRVKYQLTHLVRTHKAANDKAYSSVWEEEDEQRNVGISLSKDLMSIAGDGLRSNITTLGPLVLPISEQLLFFLNFIGRKFFPKWKPYIPDFKQAFEHFCIHAGGRAVIEELAKNLDLLPKHTEPSQMTLHRFGNTSSSSLWYEMSYVEAKGRMKKGDRVWQIALGSGFKCNSAVWKCIRTVRPTADNVWFDCIDRYPVHIPEVVKML